MTLFLINNAKMTFIFFKKIKKWHKIQVEQALIMD